MWKKYFKVVEIVPGPVIIQGIGTVDFSRDDLPVELCKKLFEEDCRYLQITEEGKRALFGYRPKRTVSTTKKTTTARKSSTLTRKKSKR